MLTVVICTFDPRKEYLEETISSLRQQTLSADKWALVVVDNASKEPVSGWLDLGWHPNARHVLEASPGIAAARIRGSREAGTDWIVYVDDDNVLDPDYLERCLAHVGKYPEIGALGGYCTPKFETPPREDCAPYLSVLAIMPPSGDRFSTQNPNHAIPWTAGICVRRTVLEAFARRCEHDFEGLPLGETGRNLLRGEDNEIIFVAWDLGYVTARLNDLHFVHLISSHRVNPDYLVRLRQGTVQSSTLISLVRKQPGLFPRRSLFYRMIKTMFILLCIWPLLKKRMELATLRGRFAALQIFEARGKAL